MNRIWTPRELGSALQQLQAAGQLDQSGLNGLRERIGRDAELLRLVERVGNGESLAGIFELKKPDLLKLTAPAALTPRLAPPAPNVRAAALQAARNEKIEVRAAREVWKIGDLPMAAPLGWFVPTLWAQGGPLDKLDALLAKRGLPTGAVAYEKRSAFADLIGEEPGHYSPDLIVTEEDAPNSTGVNFVSAILSPSDPNRHLPLSPDVRLAVDFLNNEGTSISPVFDEVKRRFDSKWTAVSRNGRQPLTVQSEVVTRGEQRFVRPIFRDAAGKRVPTSTVMLVCMRPDGSIKGDGEARGIMLTDFFGSCNGVAVAGRLFDKPKHAVAVDGVTFSPADIMALLAAVARSQVDTRTIMGTDYIGEPDLLVLKSGEVEGKVDLATRELLLGDVVRSGRSIIASHVVNRPIKVRKNDGSEQTIKPEEVIAIVREDRRDLEPSAVHQTVIEQMRKGEPVTLDTDSGRGIANESFDGARIESTGDKPFFAPSPKDLVGHRGAYRGGELAFVKMELLRGSEVEKTYHYWIEKDAAGEVVNSGWLGVMHSDWFVNSPDYVWAPESEPKLSGTNESNPFVSAALVNEIYRRSLAEPKP